MSEKPDCYQCEHRRTLLGSAHSKCVAREARVIGDGSGIARGWFVWPYNFDPVWLRACDSFRPKETRGEDE